MKKILFFLFLFIAVFGYAQNDDCSGAIPLTVGTDFDSDAIISSNIGAITDGNSPSCRNRAVENVWFSVVVPASGNIRIETRRADNSLFTDSVLTVYNGACDSLTEIECDDDDGPGNFSLISLTGQTPGETIYISVWKYSSSTNNGDFKISAYDPAAPGNDNCSEAIPLTAGTDFDSNAITSSTFGATTDESLPVCGNGAVENVWFSVVVPASGNIRIETRRADNSLFTDSVLTVYNGACDSLTEIGCDDDGGEDSFSLVSLAGQVPGTTLYISVWKQSFGRASGSFRISAYDFVPATNDNCSEAVPLTVGADFESEAIISGNFDATTEGNPPSCRNRAIENVWFSVVVPPSGNITIETKEADGSLFDDSTLTVYSGACGSLTEIGCNDDGGEDRFSLISLTGQTPGDTLYISVWKYDSNVDAGEFQISAYDESVLSTHEVAAHKKKITLYPNPFSDEINISDIDKVKTILVSDSSGRLIKMIETPSATVDLGDLKAGMYFITLKMKDGTLETIKTIKK